MLTVEFTSELGQLSSLYTFSMAPSSDHVITGAGVIPGRGRGLHPGGVAAAGACREDNLQGCDAGELQPSGLRG